MKTVRVFRSLAVCLLAACWHSGSAGAAPASAPGTIGGFKIGMQAYTFRSNTFEEAVAKTAALGLRYIEGYPGQPLSASMPGVAWSPDASPAAREKARQILRSHKVQMHNFGVVGLPDNEDECRKVFDFAREMGVKVIVSEPSDKAWPLVERLAREYRVKVAIHNHPAPSHYSNPAFELKALHGRDSSIGACADIGHWVRSGYDPLDALRKLKGRILAMHLKDPGRKGPGARDVVFGTGVIDLPGVFKELKKQKFDGVISIEYEAAQPDPAEPVRQSLDYLRRILSRA